MQNKMIILYFLIEKKLFLLMLLGFIALPSLAYYASLGKSNVNSKTMKQLVMISMMLALIYLIASMLNIYLNLLYPLIVKQTTVIVSLTVSVILLIVSYIAKKKYFSFKINFIDEESVNVKHRKYLIITIVAGNAFFFLFSFLKYHQFFINTDLIRNEMTFFSVGIFFVCIQLIYNVFLAPVAEEFFFRGIVYQAGKCLGNYYSMIMSSLMWTLIHPLFNVYDFISLFLYGLLYAYFYEKTGLLIVPILIHLMRNFWYVFGISSKYLISEGFNMHPLTMYLLAFIGLSIMMLASIRMTEKTNRVC